uniref:Uncharacterized protein n=1 Tax=Panagrellus redivivus TaxID=6233 RepID=A0A7E4VPZ9_PANRE
MASTVFTVALPTVSLHKVPKTIRQRCRITVTQNRFICNRIFLVAVFIGFAGLGTFGTYQTIFNDSVKEANITDRLLYKVPYALNSANQFCEAGLLLCFVILLPRHGTGGHTKFKKACCVFLLSTILTTILFAYTIIATYNPYNNFWDTVMLLAPIFHVIYHVKYFWKRGYTVNYHVNAVDRRLRNQSIDPQVYDYVYPTQRQAIEPRTTVTKF